MTQNNEPEKDKSDANLKSDVYADGERAWMESTQRLRGNILGPMLNAMQKAHIRPNHLTAASCLCGLAFCPMYYASTVWAFVLLLLHVVLDGIDGPLARHMDIASRRGSFTDTISDQIVVTATTIFLMGEDMVSITAGSMYIATYLAVVLFAMVRNFMQKPYSWLVRPRFYVYIWMVVETYWWPGTLEYLMWICVILLSLKVLTGFRRIRDEI